MSLLNVFHSIKSKLIMNVILIHIVMMGFVVWDLNSRQSEFMQKQLSNKGYELSALIAKNASHVLLNNDLVALDELLFDMKKVDDLHMIFIVDNFAKVRASTEKGYFNQILSDEISKDLFGQIQASKNIFVQNTHSNVIDTYHKIVINNQTVGYVRVMLDNSSLQNELQSMTIKGYLYILIAIIFGGLFAFATVRKISSKLSQIEVAADEISKQNFNITLADEKANDELSKAIRAFSLMISSIQKYIGDVEQSKKLFEDIFNAIPASVFWKDRKLNYVWGNHLFLRDAGFLQAEDIVGKNDYEMVWAKYAKEYQVDDEIVINTKIPKINYEEKIITSDGTEQILLTSKVPMIDAKGHCLGVIGVFFDITQQRENEKMLQQKDKLLAEQSKLASMGEMIGNIAHQWRQPLSVVSTIATGIKLHLEMFDEVDKKQLIGDLETINASAQFLSKTIDDFRNFLKNDSLPNEFPIHEIFDSISQIMGSNFRNNDISLILEGDFNIVLYSYKNELIQVFLNILNNAKDALKDASNIFLEEKVIKIITSQKDEFLMIEIFDNGGGISEDIINRVFEPYFTTKHQSQGTGLGLYMSRQIIEKLDGKINVANCKFELNAKEYKGAKFQILLPN